MRAVILVCLLTAFPGILSLFLLETSSSSETMVLDINDQSESTHSQIRLTVPRRSVWSASSNGVNMLATGLELVSGNRSHCAHFCEKQFLLLLENKSHDSKLLNRTYADAVHAGIIAGETANQSTGTKSYESVIPMSGYNEGLSITRRFPHPDPGEDTINYFLIDHEIGHYKLVLSCRPFTRKPLCSIYFSAECNEGLAVELSGIEFAQADSALGLEGAMNEYADSLLSHQCDH